MIEPQPIFAFGFERSGTTLLTLLLSAHPEIAVPFSVSGLWYDLYEKFPRKINTQQRELAAPFLEALFENRRIQRLALPFDKEELGRSLSEFTFPAIFHGFHSLLALKASKRLWANMDISTLDKMHVAYSWFPKARFIHLVRDGRDVAVSHSTMPYGSANTWTCARAWKSRVGCNVRMGAMLPSSQYLLCKYEDIVRDPIGSMHRICSFIGIAFSDEMINYTGNASVHIPRDRDWLWPKLFDGFSTDSVGRWNAQMRPANRIIFEREAGDLLDELGYETFDEIPRKANTYALEMWQVATSGRPVARLLAKLGFRLTSRLERRAGRPFVERRNGKA